MSNCNSAKILIVLLAIACYSCNSGRYELKFQPAHDTDYRLIYKIGGTIETAMMGKEIKSDLSTSIAGLVHFDTLPNHKTAVSFEYDAVDLGGNANNNMDSSTNENGDSVRFDFTDLLKAIQFKAVLSEQGKMESKPENDSVWKMVEAGLSGIEEPLRTQIGASIKPLVNVDMMAGLLEQSFYVMPKGKVDIGDKWRNQVKMQAIFSMLILNEFELMSVKNGLAEIAISSTITNADSRVVLPGLAMASSPSLGQPDANKGFDLMGMKFEAAFKGTQKGVIFIDMGTGLMQNAFMEQNLTGTLKISTLEIPMKLMLKNEYKTVKQ